MIAVSNRTIDELSSAIQELELLTSKPKLSSKDEARHAFLLSKVSLLKAGINPAELRRYETDRLLAEAGLPRAPERGRGKLAEEIEQEWRSFGKDGHVRPTSVPLDREVRSNEAGQQAITYTQDIPGGAFVPQGMYDRAFEVMRQHDQAFDPMFSNIVETDDGRSTAFPIWDDAASASVQVGENIDPGEADVANFGSTQLNAYSFRSKRVAVSLELLQDSNFPIGAVLERVFACRHARGVGAALINGSGVNAPTGLLTATVASGAVPVIASGSSANTGGAETGAATIGTQDIDDLYHKLDAAYRPGSAWYMQDDTLRYLEGLVDKNGHPIVKFAHGLTGPFADAPLIMGKPVAICPSMPAMGAAKNSVLFGNPLYFVQRRVPSSMYVRRYWQAPGLVENGLLGFESWLRVDSGIVAPNTNYLPYQFIQQHS